MTDIRAMINDNAQSHESARLQCTQACKEWINDHSVVLISRKKRSFCRSLKHDDDEILWFAVARSFRAADLEDLSLRATNNVSYRRDCKTEYWEAQLTHLFRLSEISNDRRWTVAFREEQRDLNKVRESIDIDLQWDVLKSRNQKQSSEWLQKSYFHCAIAETNCVVSILNSKLQSRKHDCIWWREIAESRERERWEEKDHEIQWWRLEI